MLHYSALLMREINRYRKTGSRLESIAIHKDLEILVIRGRGCSGILPKIEIFTMYPFVKLPSLLLSRSTHVSRVACARVN